MARLSSSLTLIKYHHAISFLSPKALAPSLGSFRYRSTQIPPRIIAEARRNSNNVPYHEFMFAAMVIDCDSAPYTINMMMERRGHTKLEIEFQLSSPAGLRMSFRYLEGLATTLFHEPHAKSSKM